LTDGDPELVAIENAHRKAQAAAAGRRPGDGPVLACDTVVALAGGLLGKPVDANQSRAHLLALSGRTHRVISAVEVVDDDGVRAGLDHADVRFRELDAALVDWYLATGEGDDKAGAYAVQGAGAALVDRIDGHPSTVIGLPVPVVLELLPRLFTHR